MEAIDGKPETVKFLVEISAETDDALRAEAQRERRSRTAHISYLLEKYVQESQKTNIETSPIDNKAIELEVVVV